MNGEKDYVILEGLKFKNKFRAVLKPGKDPRMNKQGKLAFRILGYGVEGEKKENDGKAGYVLLRDNQTNKLSYAYCGEPGFDPTKKRGKIACRVVGFSPTLHGIKTMISKENELDELFRAKSEALKNKDFAKIKAIHAREVELRPKL